MPKPTAQRDERVLVGNETHDDAGVYRLKDDLALVHTIDFFTPVVDDPKMFGRIAATNSLSDIYAMGGTPINALNLLATPADVLDASLVAEMLQGGQEAMEENDTPIIGGHTIDDPEPKMGYAVTGLVHPEHIWRNSTARPKEHIYLTKPIGTGVLVKAIKDGTATFQMAEPAAHMMATSNRWAKEAISRVGDPGACTDVTGFGLLGHLWEMAHGAGLRAVLWADQVPLLPGALALAEADAFPSGSVRNWEYVAPFVEFSGPLTARLRLLADAVTSGGLLFTVPPQACGDIEQSFKHEGLDIWAIGEMEAGHPGILLK